MAKDIPRNTLRQLVREYKSNGLFGSTSSKTVNKKNTLKVYNDTGAILPAGSFVGLSGFQPTTTSYDDAHSLMLGGNLVLRGVAASTSLTNAVITKPIAAETIGVAECEGVEFIVAHINNDTHTEISVARETVASGGAYAIIAKSSKDSSNNAVCAVKEKNSSNWEQLSLMKSFQQTSNTYTVFAGYSVSPDGHTLYGITYDIYVPVFIGERVTGLFNVILQSNSGNNNNSNSGNGGA